jgi:hypothetical protein
MGRYSKRSLHTRKIALCRHAIKRARAKTDDGHISAYFEADELGEEDTPEKSSGDSGPEDSSSEEEEDIEIFDNDEAEFNGYILFA